jgi:hypothetical protein
VFGSKNPDTNRPVDLEPKTTIFVDQKDTNLRPAGEVSEPAAIERPHDYETRPEKNHLIPMMDPVVSLSQDEETSHILI